MSLLLQTEWGFSEEWEDRGGDSGLTGLSSTSINKGREGFSENAVMQWYEPEISTTNLSLVKNFNYSSTTLENLGLDLEKWKAMKNCTLEHSCCESFNNSFTHERRVFKDWYRLCLVQCPEAASLRLDENGKISETFWCSLVAELRVCLFRWTLSRPGHSGHSPAASLL